MRKNSYGSGAACQAVLIAILRRLKQRGSEAIKPVTAALEHYNLNGPPTLTSPNLHFSPLNRYGLLSLCSMR